LHEEVQTEGLVRNIGGFARFLEAISFSHANVLNISNVARECEIERKVVENYINITEDLLLAYRLPIFTKRAKRKVIAHPKFYFFDAGVFRSLRPSGPLDQPQEIEGAALEGLVAQHLRAWIAYREQKSELYFWRTYSRVEVDFVIYGADNFIAIEVKNSHKIRLEDLHGLLRFKEEYPESKTLLLYRGREQLKKGDIWCLPCSEFLAELRPDQQICDLLLFPAHIDNL
jgi:predicted AAA+ superfamily ATPase